MAVRGWVQACEWQPRGSELTADAALDAITITLEDLTDFDDAGGILSINDQTISYDADAIDEDAGTIFLNTGLAAAASTGDPVHPVSGGQVMRDVVLFVACGDGDLVEVTAAWSQRDYWPEGDYEDPVQVMLSDDLEEILDAPGRIPQSSELAEARGGYEGSLQDIYDAADAAAEAAADAAANATTAVTAANGKNKVTYSLSAPGSTANTAGDIWFRKDSATQTIIGQWQGQGGTSWQQVTLNDQVIANLDAGKLVAGSAFINGLTVKTNFNLGDAATNGVIQSYNFAGSAVGVYIDKFGLVAKGGSIAGAAITGGTVTSTDGSSTIQLANGQLRFGSSAYMMEASPYNLYISAGAGAIGFSSTGINIGGATTFTNNVDVDGTLASPRVEGDEVFVMNKPVEAGGEAVFMTGGGRLIVHTAPSLLAYKDEVSEIDVDLDALAQVCPITWRYKADVPFEVDDPGETFHGIPADPLVENPRLTFLTSTNDDGVVSVKEQRLPLALLAGFGDHHSRIAELERGRAEDHELIGQLLARIEALENS